MKESVTIALLQFESVLGDPAANRKKGRKDGQGGSAAGRAAHLLSRTVYYGGIT